MVISDNSLLYSQNTLIDFKKVEDLKDHQLYYAIAIIGNDPMCTRKFYSQNKCMYINGRFAFRTYILKHLVFIYYRPFSKKYLEHWSNNFGSKSRII